MPNDIIHNIIDLEGGIYQTNSIDSAYNFCKKITLGHYENFPVASIFIPKNLRPHIYAIYTFARIADDIADTNNDDKIKKLEFLRNNLINFDKKTTNPLFLALFTTIESKKLPKELFFRLLDAFVSDSNFVHPEKLDQVLSYCNNSANPVGELILRVFDEATDENIELSNHICTALQLINFWQDLSVDLDNGRFYIWKEILDKHQIKIENLKELKNKELLDEIYNITDVILQKGKKLIPKLKDKRLKFEINFIFLSGSYIFEKVKRMELKIFSERPKLSKIEFIYLFFKSVI